MKKIFFLILILVVAHNTYAQPVQLYNKGTLKANQDKLYSNLVRYTINHNLTLPLTDSTEENWQDAFQAMEVLRYKTPWIERKIRYAAENILTSGISFQRAFIELLYTLYPGKFNNQVQQVLLQSTDAKIFAMCAVYLMQSDSLKEKKKFLNIKTRQLLAEHPQHPILLQLQYFISNYYTSPSPPSIKSLLLKDYLPGNVLLFSFQRKNRDYPGMAMIRDAEGNFIKDSTGNYFFIPQLARSVSNLPAFLTNGNTPEGILRMDKFEVSVSSFIGPTPNLQLSMPFEKKMFHFFNTQNDNDTLWDIERYKKLLPSNFQNYYPMMQSWFAGMAGRTEIIAHGSTVNPAYYFAQPYYPLTPTQGCLAAKEIWSNENGKRKMSDQQKLVDAVLKAGGAHGYAIVINIDDAQKPVSITDILPYLKLAAQK